MSEGAEGLTGVRFLSGSPSEEEIAAVSAVLAVVIEEEHEAAELEPQTATSAWARSQRPLRSSLTPGAGRWRSFG